MISRNLLALSIASALFSMPAMAADNPGSHQHGHAEMQLAFSADQVEILILSPAGNMLGFEHEPRTPEQHEMIESVTGWFGETPLVNTLDSTCTVIATQVQHEVGGGHDHDEHDHDDHDHEDAHDHDHHDHDESGHDNEAQHSDITVTQTLNCPGLDQSANLTTPLTTRFSGIEDLDIAWAGPDGQGAARLEHGESSFSLER